MARLIAEHFKRDGRPKRSYDSYFEALEAAQNNSQQPYECSFCGQWHTGGYKKWPKVKRY